MLAVVPVLALVNVPALVAVLALAALNSLQKYLVKITTSAWLLQFQFIEQVGSMIKGIVAGTIDRRYSQLQYLKCVGDQRSQCVTILIWHWEALEGSVIWHILVYTGAFDPPTHYGKELF